MPFVVPNLPFAFGSRTGNTTLLGSLNPTQSGGTSRLGAEIGASIPWGVIATTTSWGFTLAAPLRGATTLIVAASGTTFERASSVTWGGYASATAEISTTIEEFVFNRRTGVLDLVRAVTSAPTPIFNLTNWGIGAQVHTRDTTASTVLAMPIQTGRFRSFRCWINAQQSAGCSGGIGGAGGGVSRLFFDIGPVFFAFA